MTSPFPKATVIVILLLATLSFSEMPYLTSPAIVEAQTHPGFVHVCGNRFCRGDGSRLVLNSVDIMIYNSSIYNEKDFWALRNAGINGVRLNINWGLLEPAYQQYNDIYIAEIEQIRGWAQKYELYVTVNIINWNLPEWLPTVGRIYTDNGTAELVRTWTWLANLFKDDWNLLAYQIPWNEPSPPDYRANNNTYVDQMKHGYNMTYLWQQWLKARYGTIQALNATWNARIYDQLNGTGSPPYRPIDYTSARGYHGEDKWIGIKPLGQYSYEFHWKPNPPFRPSARWTDWQLFRLDLLANLTRRVALTIRNIDPNHILATFRPGTVGDGQGVDGGMLLPRLLAQVPEIRAIAYHRYLDPGSPYVQSFQHGRSAYFGSLIANEAVFISQLFPDIVIWHDEWGAMDGRSPPDENHGPNQVSMTLAQDQIAGLMEGGWNIHYYTPSQFKGEFHPWTDVVNSTTGEFEGPYYHLRYFMRMEDHSTPRTPDVLVIVPRVRGWGYSVETQVFPFSSLHVSVGVVEESYVTTNLLDNFKAVVYWYAPGQIGANRTTVETVVDWAKSGHYVLWLGFGNNYDMYLRSGPSYSPLAPLEGYLLRPGASTTRYSSSNTHTISFSKSFGDIPAGTSLQIAHWSQGVALGYDSSDVAEVNGLQIVARDIESDKYALWYNGTSVFFYGPLSGGIPVQWDLPFPTSYSDSYLRIARAFLSFAGVWYDDRTDFNIQYRYDAGGGFLVAYERLGQAGTYTLRLDLQKAGLDASEKYILWQVMNWTTYGNSKYVFGYNLTNLPLRFQANQTILLRILPYDNRCVVYSDAVLASEAYDANTKLLTLTYGNNAVRDWKLVVSQADWLTYILNARSYDNRLTGDRQSNILTLTVSGSSTVPVTLSYGGLGGFFVFKSTASLHSVTWDGIRKTGSITVVGEGISVQVYSSPANATVLQSTGPVQVNVITTSVTRADGSVWKLSKVMIYFPDGTLIINTPQLPA